MPLNPDLITCQVSRLVDGSGAWDWNEFVSTIIATVVGGAISLVGVWWALRWQLVHRYGEVLDDSIARVLQEIAAYATAVERSLRQQEAVEFYAARGLDFFAKTGEDPREEPTDFALSITLDVAQMRARGDDQDLLTAAIRVSDGARHSSSLRRRTQVLGLIGGALSRWRSGIWSSAEARASLARAAAFAEDNDVEVEIQE